jgi:hypothetical protein
MQATTASGVVATQQIGALRARLVADDALQLAHHVGEGVRSHDRTEAVVRGVHGRHPLAHGLVHSVLECPAPRRHRPDLGPQELHAEDVELLALRVHLAHEDGAVEAEECRRRGRRHTVLARPRLGDHPGLAHPLGQEGLPHHVVELVRARMRQVLPLEEDAHAQALRQARAFGHRRGATAVVVEQPVELGPERRVGPGVVEPLLQFQAGRHQGLRHEATAELAEAAVGARTAHQAGALVAHASLQS